MEQCMTMVTICLVVLAAGFAPITASAAPADTGSDPAGEPLDSETIDEIVEHSMEEWEVAGATVAVVEGEETTHLEAYGYADYEAGDPVDPEDTSFMVGSVAKLLVWTTVMQGVEDGTLALDEPIGTYLEEYEFEGDDEITLEHLATHSAGYEDRLQGLFLEDEDALADWEASLEDDMPAKIRQAGSEISYSNHGTALAGLVVQEAYDESFEEHVDEQIFEPLDMNRATFEQPVPDDRDLSKGHMPTEDGFTSHDPAIVGIPPAGSMSATAPDMANFASAKLQSGAFEDERILAAETVEEMFDERATNQPNVRGIGFGYMLSEYRGERVVYHTGGTAHFQTLFALFPEHDVALFVSFNTPAPTTDVVDRFMEERFDATGEEREPDPATAERADRYNGEYHPHVFETTYERVLNLASATTVSVDDDGVATVSQLDGPPRQWVESEEGIFVPKSPDDSALGVTRMVIENDRLYMGGIAPPYERAGWYTTTTVQAGLALGSLLLLFSTLVVWPINAYRHRGWGEMRAYLGAPRRVILASVGLLAGFLIGVLLSAPQDLIEFTTPFSIWFRASVGLLFVVGLAGIAAAVLTGREWHRRTNSPADAMNTLGLVYLSIMVLAIGALLWQVWYWNLYTAAF